MITVLTWMWDTRYSAAHVNALRRQVARHYARPHRFACVTNQPQGLDCETIPDREAFAGLTSPHGAQFSSCYRRLDMFAPDAAERYGERFICLDLDMIIVADVAPLWDRLEDCVLLRDPLYPTQVNGSMLLLSAGSRPRVWTEFDPARSPDVARARGFRGSDQAWLSHCLPSEPRWGPEDGVLSYRKHIIPRGGSLPAGARIVSFHGKQKPWDTSLPWVREAA